MECKVVAAYDVGTHLIFIGELLEADIIDITKEPLTYDYYRQVKKGLSPKNAPTYIDKSKLNKITESEAKPATAQNKKYKCFICGYLSTMNPRATRIMERLPAQSSNRYPQAGIARFAAPIEMISKRYKEISEI
jgi:hypothetical protein